MDDNDNADADADDDIVITTHTTGQQSESNKQTRTLTDVIAIQKQVECTSYTYNPRKPKWWNKLANNGRGATKAQKRCMRKILDGNDNGDDQGNTGNGNDNDNGNTEGVKIQLRLPIVDYGSQLNWDNVFHNPDASSDSMSDSFSSSYQNQNQCENRAKDIWMEVGFGRGENLLALLDTKLFNNRGNSNNNLPTKVGNVNVNVNNFHLVGAEISSVGIGCFCRRIDQRIQKEQQQQQQYDDDNKMDNTRTTTTTTTMTKTNNNSSNDDDLEEYVLYRPELDPYSVVVDADDDTYNEQHNVNKQRQQEQSNSNSALSSVPLSLSLSQQLQNRLRIHAGDGYKLLPKIPSHSLAVILITFPDPFENKGKGTCNTQYRFIQKQTLLECYRILRKSKKNDNNNKTGTSDADGGLLYLATDHDGYYDWCHQMVHEVNKSNSSSSVNNINKKDGSGMEDNGDNDSTTNNNNPSSSFLFRLVEPCPNRSNWLPAISTYEQKGWKEGRSTKLSCWMVV